jgi:hypothetical protein
LRKVSQGILAQRAEPDEAKQETEILAMWEAHDEKQRALNEAWGAYWKAVRKHDGSKTALMKEKADLDKAQAELNAEREALPTRPMARCGGGMSKAARLKLVRQIRDLNYRG